MGVETKRCLACGQTLPADRFRRDRTAGDGLKGRCKACVAAGRRVDAEVRPPDPGPARQLRYELARRRQLGEDFATAWTFSTATVCATHPEWRQVFAWSRCEWGSAFERGAERPRSFRLTGGEAA
jgi:hypothetical protein